ncbi:hypothetical protein O7602_16270 [Micromonospora sp. WMMD1128]|uniref:hypothetical protein n=1 Tax=unclassified Micromonospora TaxID=2617518 RepID=UPI00248AED49|nr:MULTISPECIES: hypothetical protein [unclassified Micromonospora]WBB71316.1 hypothetical protein O7602_16270 [Micromonospora sp. WMMD1128]WFE35215.1 hypothetical protein O7613_07500 [Micromonospora sp. WMMD975]
MPTVRERLHAFQVAHARVCDLLEEMERAVAGRFPPADPGPAGRAAEEHLLRLHCLALALVRRQEDLAGLDPAQPADEATLARLLAAPCPVRFTAATGDQVRVEQLRVARIVQDAADQAEGIRRLVAAPAPEEPTPDPHRLAERGRRLRSSLHRLRRLAAEAAAEGLGDVADPLAPLTADGLLDRLAAADPGHRPDTDAEALGAALDRDLERVDAVRRSLRVRCHRELSGRLEAYRQRAADEGRAEHPDLERSYRDAVAGLRPATFGVAAASRAVRAYQQAVNGGAR